jgi:hypothetical protein
MVPEVAVTDPSRKKRPRQYPPLYEKLVPVALVVIAIVIVVLLLIVAGVIFGFFPGIG